MTESKIWKQPILLQEEPQIVPGMPRFAGYASGDLSVWFSPDDVRHWRLLIIATGEAWDEEEWEYLTTVARYDAFFVWHILIQPILE